MVWPPGLAVGPGLLLALSYWLVYACVDTRATAIITTPMCTIIPPLARPTSPRQPVRRVASATWRPAALAAKPPRPKASSGVTPSAPITTASTTAPTPHHAGQNRRWRKSSVDALRHGRTGATAI